MVYTFAWVVKLCVRYCVKSACPCSTPNSHLFPSFLVLIVDVGAVFIFPAPFLTHWSSCRLKWVTTMVSWWSDKMFQESPQHIIPSFRRPPIQGPHSDFIKYRNCNISFGMVSSPPRIKRLSNPSTIGQDTSLKQRDKLFISQDLWHIP